MKQKAYDKITKQPLNISAHALDHKQNERNNQLDFKVFQTEFTSLSFSELVSTPLGTAYVLGWCKMSRISSFLNTEEEKKKKRTETNARFNKYFSLREIFNNFSFSFFPGEIILYNVYYEINPFCTSIIGQDDTGTVATLIYYLKIHFLSTRANLDTTIDV